MKLAKGLIVFTCFQVVAGCDRSPELVPVHGVVQYKGKTLSFGNVMFQPDGGGKMARSSITSDGTFQLSTNEPGDGAKTGKYRVRVTAFELQKRRADGDSTEEPSLGRSAIPKKYQSFGTSQIVVDVQSEMTLPVTIKLD